MAPGVGDPERPPEPAAGDPCEEEGLRGHPFPSRAPGGCHPHPRTNVTNGCLRAEVWSKQSPTYMEASHSATLMA